ncbi:MAG: FkbM family methyltransferase [Candidatus Hodarchaeales archaeon]|jgi:FkbM family methyltransferase
MKRSLKDFLSFKTISYIRYIPVSIFRVKNWYPFLLNYIGLKNDNFERVYKLRNGVAFKSVQSLDAATIFVIFIRKDYGDVPDDSIIVDIGANIGVYSVYASLMGKNNKIFAYEPVIDNFNVLQENIQLNNSEENIVAFNLGVSSQKEKRKLFLIDAVEHTLIEKNETQNFIEIECVSLNDIIEENNLPKIDLLKMDCEGAEYEILYNTAKENLQKIQEIRMEFHVVKDHDVHSLAKYLEENGFKVNLLKKGNLWCKKANK